MALLGDIQIRGDGSDPKQIMNYLYQLEEQIQYALQNIGADNIVEGSIGPALLSPAIKTQINNVVLGQEAQQRTSKQLKSEDGKLRTLIVETEQGIMRQLTNEVNGLQTTITETAAGINAKITSAEGDITQLKATAGEIQARITNEVAGLETNISATAANLQAWVKDNAYEIQSGIAINPAGVTISGGKYVKIESTGKFILDSQNLKVDDQGNVEMTGEVNAESGEIGGFNISSYGLGTTGGGVWISSGGGSSASSAVTVYGPGGTGDVAFQALSASGTVYIKSLWLYDGTTWRDVTSAILALL